MEKTLLSKKQNRILQYRLGGKTNKEIAELENCTERAVSSCVNAIKLKYVAAAKNCKVKIAKNIDKIGSNSYAVFTTFAGKTVYLCCTKTLEDAIRLRDLAEEKKRFGAAFFLEWKNSLKDKDIY
ncbi:MAG: LuxR C-terminal-related transcriptional regulator [Lachnospiraceae bacterium]|nr:LuxR C-terminal-related transcriptional regulator [Lachnospiraceae bacterium]